MSNTNQLQVFQGKVLTEIKKKLIDLSVRNAKFYCLEKKKSDIIKKPVIADVQDRYGVS